MPILLPEELNIEFPKMVTIKQKFNRELIKDIEAVIEKEVEKEEIARKIKPGQRIAVAVGSRGIRHIDRIVKKTVDCLKEKGAYPFIISAMGSHGGGVAEGQKAILESYGITEEKMGVPILVGMDVVKIGTTSKGKDVYYDAIAHQADMTVLINRIKPHTDFEGEIESGICKMAVIGLGNHKGCISMHKSTLHDFPGTIIEAAKIIFEKCNVGFGVAVVENAFDQTFQIESIAVENILKREPELLKLSKSKMPRIHIPEIDILIVEEIGKNISGTGADPNIIGGFGPKAKSENVPQIKWIVILDLTEESHGNAIGIGIGHITTKKVLERMDFEATYANCLASGGDFGFETGFLPLIMGDEKEAIAAAFKLWGGEAPSTCRVVRIKNTLQLEYIQVSEALLPYVNENGQFFDTSIAVSQ